jgi:hypothetical protein
VLWPASQREDISGEWRMRGVARVKMWQLKMRQTGATGEPKEMARAYLYLMWQTCGTGQVIVLGALSRG